MQTVSFNFLVDNYPSNLNLPSAERLELEQKLEPWRKPDSHGKQRAKCAGSSFTIKYNNSHFTLHIRCWTIFFRCVGVWDTVGSFGLPEELSISSKNKGCPFDFPDRILGEHIERAYQALAINEPRADFVSFFDLKLPFKQALTCL